MTLLVAALTVAMLLVIWFDTDAFVEYLGWLPCFRLQDYKTVKATTTDYISYPNFLSEFHDNFFSRLVTCPVCISVWFSIGVSLLFGTLSWFLAIAFLGLSFYQLFNKLK
jgi:hypothetical protein